MAAETCDDEDVPDLAKEKEIALNIIDKVVGKNRKRSRNAKSKTMDEDEEVRQQNNTDSAHVVKPVTPSPKLAPKNNSAADDNKNVYYEVATSLKNAFTKSTESTNTTSSSHVFKFHTDGDFSEELATEDDGHDEGHDETVMETVESVPDSAPYDEAFLFFFHSSSRELRNRLDGTQFFSSYSKY